MKVKCQCPQCHCDNEFEELDEKSVDVYPMTNTSTLDREKDIRYLESQTHLAICPMCASGEHKIFE